MAAAIVLETGSAAEPDREKMKAEKQNFLMSA
jgi:hypothetical protein